MLVLLNKEYDEKCDLYSFAIVLWVTPPSIYLSWLISSKELLTQQEPFPDIESFDVMLEEVCILNHRPPIPEDTPGTFHYQLTSSLTCAQLH